MPQASASITTDGDTAGYLEPNTTPDLNSSLPDNEVQDLNNPELGFENREDDMLDDVSDQESIADEELITLDSFSYN
jgi:hypothetical protein